MSFMKLLQGIGDKLGILEAVSVPGNSETVRIQTRTVSLRALTAEVKPGVARILADTPAELATSFDEIFKAAGISANPMAWTSDRLKQAIESGELRNKPREEAQKTILALLKAEGVSPEGILKDAIARDQAMDAFEGRAREKMRARQEACRACISAAESRIRELTEECAALEQSLNDDQARWDEWKRQKRARERELASVVSYIVDHRVITSEEDQESGPIRSQ